MALVLKDRVKQLTETDSSGGGNSTIDLQSASVTGFQTFTTALADGDTFYYSIVDNSAGTWETGLGTWDETNRRITRTTVYDNSNNDTSAVNFANGAKEVFITQPASKAIFEDASDNLTFTGDFQAAGVYVGATNASFDLYNNGTSYFNGAVTVDDTLAVNSGTTNTVATFTSTDSVAEIQMTDSSGTAGISAEGDTFQVRPAGGSAVVSVTATHLYAPQAVFSGNVSVDGGKLIATTSSATGGTDTANVAEFNKNGMSAGSNIVAYENADGYSGGFVTNIDENTNGGVSVQDTTSTNGNTLGGLMYFQDTRSTNHNHVLSSYKGSTYTTNLTINGDTSNATFGGTVTATSFNGKILDTTSGSNYVKLTSTNEFNLYNSSDVSQTLHLNYTGGNVDLGQSAMVVNHGGAIEFNNEIIADNYLRLRTIDDQASQWYIYNDTTDNLTFNYGNAGGGEFVLETDGDLDIAGALTFTTDNMLLTTSQSFVSSSGRNPWIRINTTGSHGLLLTDSANANPIQMYADTSSNYGFLNSDWGSWDIKKNLNGNLYLNNTTTYYLNPNSTSNLNYLVAGESKTAFITQYSNGFAGNAGDVLTSNGSGTNWSWTAPSSGYTANFTGYASAFSVGTSSTGSSGEIRATNNITAYYSDERLKDFHGKIENAVDKVKQLNGYYFSENEKAKEFGYEKQDKKQIGVSAQEVEKVLPEIVSQAPFDIAEDGSSKSGENYKTVDYEKLVPLLIEAIKEQQIQIDNLKECKCHD